jgi:hypothetical protein
LLCKSKRKVVAGDKKWPVSAPDAAAMGNSPSGFRT